MIPTSLLSEITSTAPTALSAILSIASYTVWSGVTNQTSLPFRFKTEPIVPVIFIIAWSPLMRRFLADREGKGIGGNYALGGPEVNIATSRRPALSNKTHQLHQKFSGGRGLFRGRH